MSADSCSVRRWGAQGQAWGCVCARVHACVSLCVCVHACMRMYVCMCARVWLYTCMCLCACMPACMCACIHTRVSLCVHACACMCACIHVCLCACARLHVHVCMPVCTRVCMPVYTHVCVCVPVALTGRKSRRGENRTGHRNQTSRGSIRPVNSLSRPHHSLPWCRRFSRRTGICPHNLLTPAAQGHTPQVGADAMVAKLSWGRGRGGWNPSPESHSSNPGKPYVKQGNSRAADCLSG